MEKCGAYMLEVKNLTKAYAGGRAERRGEAFAAVKNVSFALREGETLGVTGESGCGKTTLAKLVAGLLPADQGEIRYYGRDITKLKGRELRKLRREIQMIFQNPETALDPSMKIRQSITEVLRLNGLARAGSRQEKELTEKLVKDTGLGCEHLSRYPGQLSGGQLQRVVLARVLALSPRLLIADEPTSMLDVSVQAQILTLLKSMREASGCGCILVAHDLDVIRVMCEKTAVMCRGEIVEMGETNKVFDRPEHTYTRKLVREFYRGYGDGGTDGF